MVQARCIRRHKDFNNNIKQYVLMDNQGVKKILKSEELKEAIMQKQLLITNLTLTSDGRLVSKSSTDDVPEDVIYLTCIGYETNCFNNKIFGLKDLSGNEKTMSEQYLVILMQGPENNRYVVNNLGVRCGNITVTNPIPKQMMDRFVCKQMIARSNFKYKHRIM